MAGHDDKIGLGLFGVDQDFLGRIPAPGDRAELPGWKLSVRQVGRYRAERVRLVRTTPLAAGALPSVPAPAELESVGGR